MKKMLASAFGGVTFLLLLVLLPIQVNAEVIDSGICGNDVYWTFDDTNTLTIYGTGDMSGYYHDTMPWADYLASIQSVMIEEGVTSLHGLFQVAEAGRL